MSTDYLPETKENFVLTCGSGEQIGHGPRITTKKPRMIEELFLGTVIDIAAGGVHSVVLTNNGELYSCGINENGTIPIDDPLNNNCDSINTFTKLFFDEEIKAHGKVSFFLIKLM